MERQRDKDKENEITQINATHVFTGHRHYGTLSDRVRFEVRSETRTHVVECKTLSPYE